MVQNLNLSSLINRVVSGGFLSGCGVKGKGGDGAQITHLLFAGFSRSDDLFKLVVNMV